MATTQDNAAAIEFTAQWSADPTHIHLYETETGADFRDSKPLPSAISPAAGATVRIPAGDLNFTVTIGTAAGQLAWEVDILALIGAAGLTVWVGLGTGAAEADEVGDTDYGRQQLTAQNLT